MGEEYEEEEGTGIRPTTSRAVWILFSPALDPGEFQSHQREAKRHRQEKREVHAPQSYSKFQMVHLCSSDLGAWKTLTPAHRWKER